MCVKERHLGTKNRKWKDRCNLRRITHNMMESGKKRVRGQKEDEELTLSSKNKQRVKILVEENAYEEES